MTLLDLGATMLVTDWEHFEAHKKLYHACYGLSSLAPLLFIRPSEPLIFLWLGICLITIVIRDVVYFLIAIVIGFRKDLKKWLIWLFKQITWEAMTPMDLHLSTSSENLIVNPSFEVGTWGGPETWDSIEKKIGQYSIKLVSDGTVAEVATGWSNWVNVFGLKKLAVGVWMKINEYTQGKMAVWITFYDGARNWLAATQIGELWGANTGWRHFEKIVDVPEGAYWAKLRGYHQQKDGLNPLLTSFFDGFQLHVGQQIPEFQDYTAYSSRWLPEKIVYAVSSEVEVVSADAWETVLPLTFTTKQKSLAFILIDWEAYAWPVVGSEEAFYRWRVLLNGVKIIPLDPMDFSATFISTPGSDVSFRQSNTVHSVQELEADTEYTIELQLYRPSLVTDYLAAFNRSITVLLGVR